MTPEVFGVVILSIDCFFLGYCYGYWRGSSLK